MADWYPGAWNVNMGGNGNSISARPPENVFHIAASSWNVDTSDPQNPSKGIAGWVSSAKACNTYTDQYGNMQQYCSLFSAVNGTKDGNYRNRTHESWNPEGLNGSTDQYNSSLWTGEQCERFADFLAWDHLNNGTKIQDMQNSLSSSHGVGVHRYGVDSAGPYSRVPGGEVWTLSAGKPCPGTARVEQMKNFIIPRAVQLANAGVSPLPPGRVDLTAALARVGGGTNVSAKSFIDTLLGW